MSKKFKVGDFVTGTERADVYNYPDSRTRKAEIIEIFPVKDDGGHDVKIRILDHEDSSEIGVVYAVDSARFDKFVEVKGKGITSLEEGDLVKALPEADKVYGCTNSENMILGEVLDVDTDEEEDVLVKVVDSIDSDDIDEEYEVESKYFKAIGKKDADIQGVKFDYDEDNDILYVIIKDKYTIAVEGAESVGVASKSEYDKFGRATGEAIAKARLNNIYNIELVEEG